MNTKALNSLADVICRAQNNGKRTPMGIAFAIDSAGRHMSPETAAELEQLRVKVAELESQLAALQAQGEVLREKSADESADKLTRPLAPTQALREDDEFGLRHRYLLGRDLPPLDGVS